AQCAWLVPKTAEPRKPAPPPHHDQSNSTGSSLALAAENENSENRGAFYRRARGSLPDSERALTPRDPTLPRHRSAASPSPSPAPRSAGAPEFHARTSSLYDPVSFTRISSGSRSRISAGSRSWTCRAPSLATSTITMGAGVATATTSQISADSAKPDSAPT